MTARKRTRPTQPRRQGSRARLEDPHRRLMAVSPRPGMFLPCDSPRQPSRAFYGVGSQQLELRSLAPPAQAPGAAAACGATPTPRRRAPPPERPAPPAGRSHVLPRTSRPERHGPPRPHLELPAPLRARLAHRGGGARRSAGAEIVRRFWPYVRPYRRWIALGLLLAARSSRRSRRPRSGCSSWSWTTCSCPRDLGRAGRSPRRTSASRSLGALASFGDEYIAAWVGERFLLDLRARVFAHVQRAVAPTQLDRRRVGDLLARLTGDVQAIERFVLVGHRRGRRRRLPHRLLRRRAVPPRLELALAALVVAPLFFLAARRFARLVKRAAREKRRRSGSLSAVAEESLANARRSCRRSTARTPRSRASGARARAIVDAELAATRISGALRPARRPRSSWPACCS